MQKTRILAIVGPTASGKSALAEELALRLSGEVLSCDSMQVYRRMNVGTAKPDEETRKRIPYHLLDLKEPQEPFSVNDYCVAAEQVVKEVSARGKLPIFCGGTGLYLDSFLRGDAGSPPGDETIRRELLEKAEKEGADVLFEELQKADPISAAATHKNNLRRVVRALEIYRLSGIPKSEWDEKSRTIPPRFDATVLYLHYENREILYDRIDRRVDAMLTAGLAEETEALRAEGVFLKNSTAAGAIGYKELLPYLAGECSLNEATAALKTATRHYAKRQMTWFLAKPYIQKIAADEGNSPRKFEEIVNNAINCFNSGSFML